MATEWSFDGDPGQTLESIDGPNPNPDRIDTGTGQLDAGTYAVWETDPQTYTVRFQWSSTFVLESTTFTVEAGTVYFNGTVVGTYPGSVDLIDTFVDIPITLAGEFTAPGGELLAVWASGNGGIQASNEGNTYPVLTTLGHMEQTFNGTFVETTYLADDPDEFLLYGGHVPDGELDPGFGHLQLSCFTASSQETIETWDLSLDYVLIDGGAYYYLNGNETPIIISNTGGTGTFLIDDLDPTDEVCIFVEGDVGSTLDVFAQTTPTVQGPETVSASIVSPGGLTPLRVEIVPT